MADVYVGVTDGAVSGTVNGVDDGGLCGAGGVGSIVGGMIVGGTDGVSYGDM